ncbi:hypothetical protein [Desulfosoma caldarium]|uniref:Secreted protein n=1 Tax=Desulfosoma caldarium TaxID=610254 RepID=A0A3N1VK30_9BACT|nr:hypothetical protein [Desulfosoma caldarium]ROR03173.1 hypothetical protein EDC27_0431 [Desulfosoma caldarium]
MIRKAFWMVVTMVLMAAMRGPGFEAGGTADDTLKRTLPCVTVEEDRYRALFDFVQLPRTLLEPTENSPRPERHQWRDLKAASWTPL